MRIDKGEGMAGAIYYPHSVTYSPPFLKHALLMWDQVECIVPQGDTLRWSEDLEVRQAQEFLLRPHIPSEDEKWAAVVADPETRVRVFIAKEGEGYLASALEAFLIDRLDPPFNLKQQ